MIQYADCSPHYHHLPSRYARLQRRRVLRLDISGIHFRASAVQRKSSRRISNIHTPRSSYPFHIAAVDCRPSRSPNLLRNFEVQWRPQLHAHPRRSIPSTLQVHAVHRRVAPRSPRAVRYRHHDGAKVSIAPVARLPHNALCARSRSDHVALPQRVAPVVIHQLLRPRRPIEVRCIISIQNQERLPAHTMIHEEKGSARSRLMRRSQLHLRSDRM
jgi:hypothetical protein